MPTREYYLQQAKNLRASAKNASDRGRAERWLQRANEYVVLAGAMPDDDDAPKPTHRQRSEPQQQQQQQRGSARKKARKGGANGSAP